MEKNAVKSVKKGKKNCSNELSRFIQAKTVSLLVCENKNEL